jgi:hypothetical protein
MILNKITSKNIVRLNWFDTIYLLAENLNSYTPPCVIEKIPFFLFEENFDIILNGHYYMSNQIKM